MPVPEGKKGKEKTDGGEKKYQQTAEDYDASALIKSVMPDEMA